MWLFCICINDILKELDRQDICFIVYADDLLICVNSVDLIPEMIQKCKNLFGQIGLEINEDKCGSTADGGEIEFMGIEFSLNSRNKPISNRLSLLCDEECKKYE